MRSCRVSPGRPRTGGTRSCASAIREGHAPSWPYASWFCNCLIKEQRDQKGHKGGLFCRRRRRFCVRFRLSSPPRHFTMSLQFARFESRRGDNRQSDAVVCERRVPINLNPKPLNPLNTQTIKQSNNQTLTTVPLLRSDSPGNRKATKFVSRDSGVRVRRARQARRAERAGRRASSSLEDARRPALSRRRTPTDAPAGFVVAPQAPRPRRAPPPFTAEPKIENFILYS